MDLEKIEKIAKKLGINNLDDKTIFKLRNSDIENEKVLKLENGNLNSKLPWFVIDESDNTIYQMLSSEASILIMKTLKSVMQENMKMKLEKLILQELPLDFNDVWAVAISKLENRVNSPLDLTIKDLNDLEAIVKEIKKEHPNLFYSMNIKDIFEERESDI